MSPTVTDLDHLPPEARFAVRAAAGGLTFDETAEVLRLDGPTLRKHLRNAVRLLGGDPPAAAAGDDRLREALAPALLKAGLSPPGRRPALKCPAPAIVAALARGALDGPLVLAQAEHAADCPACMTLLVDVRRGRASAAAVLSRAAEDDGGAPPRRLLGLDPPLVFGLLAGILAAAAYLLFR